jgi:hypothetical protein
LVAGTGLVVRSVAEARPYAALPSCGDLLPADLLATIPGAERPRAEGGFIGVEHLGLWDEDEVDEGLLGVLDCDVHDASDGTPLSVFMSLYDAEDGAASLEERREEAGHQMADLAEGTGHEDRGIMAWREVSVADGGYAAVHTFSSDYEDATAHFAEAYFFAANTQVSVSYTVSDGPFGDGDAELLLDFVDGFAGQVERRLSREGERV